MYLKSIEMHGFKSFASKMKMDFHDGVTGIVGPNGSGKSNVADAVRWVLGEQSAKQLRGGNMQDVIFAGTASRKPLGFASVSITLDNSDHQLNIDYDTVVVTRRLYRSGESEYLLNGSGCRLKDIMELFYDTGVGKEGYSIIGQGQIDRIISDKPEDRRELFDEAVGIVKFKRRKTAALKKLEGEEQNLVRVTDILNELSKQVGPLERQSEKARTYLVKRDELKERDIALFVLDEDRIENELRDVKAKNTAAKDELALVSTEFEKTKQEYEVVENEMETLDNNILDIRNSQADAVLKKQQLENQIQILEEQIKGAASNRLLYEEQIANIEKDKAGRLVNLKEFEEELLNLQNLILEGGDSVESAVKNLDSVQEKAALNAAAIESKKNELLSLVDGRSSINGEIQKYKTLDEQIQVRFSALSARVIQVTQLKAEADKKEAENKAAFEKIKNDIEEGEKEFSLTEDKLSSIKGQLTDLNTEFDECQLKYHRDQSTLESVSNIAERYEGYGGSVKKIMEMKDDNAGIRGVVAELISTEKKYETAIETALGNSLQNIVTDNEATAKYLIEFLKRGKYGRATFLPLTSMNSKDESEKTPDEEGIIGVASDLVNYDKEYEGLVRKLLGRTYVIDTIDHAIGIGRRTKHKLRMVTLEGELFNVGGSISGGAYKNNSNLLGRKRQIEELEQSVAKSRKKIKELEQKISSLKDQRNAIRDEQNALNDKLKKLYIEKNTIGVQVKVAEQQSKEFLIEANSLKEEQSKLNIQRSEVAEAQKGISSELDNSSEKEKELENVIAALQEEAETIALKEKEALDLVEQSRLNAGTLTQKKDFNIEKIAAVKEEITKAENEVKRLKEAMENDSADVVKKQEDIEAVKATIEAAGMHIESLEGKLNEALAKKEGLTGKHKEFFTKREELADHRSLLEKECFRLENNLEKLENEKDGAISHLWEEYEITPLEIERKESNKTRTELIREIQEIKKDIKALGNVNVNAIEEYKDVKERHTFLSAQYEDITKSADSLKGIIAELDKGMKKQFNEKFADIKTEFDKVFKQLFGGGTGTLELLDEENVLETGVRIVAQPPGKKLQNMMQLSGGEKALTAISLLFAIQNLKPSPFCLLDEIEATLDESNVGRFAAYLHKLTENTQFIVITHRRGTMDCADRLYGITMQEKGISTMVSVDLVEGDLT